MTVAAVVHCTEVMRSWLTRGRQKSIADQIFAAPLGEWHPRPVQFGTGNPYGVHDRAGPGMPDDITLRAARHQATRAGEVAAALKAGRATGHIADGAQAWASSPPLNWPTCARNHAGASSPPSH